MSVKWILPTGIDTGIKIYNHIAGKKVPLIVQNVNSISWYTCGPTVYSKPHLGHAATYVRFDIIQRILTHYFNFKLTTAMNITDIDDKIIKASLENNQSIQEVTRNSEDQFWQDLNSLNIIKPKHLLKVTEHMNLIEDMIESLLEKGYAYKNDTGSVNFNIQKIQHLYGKLRKNIRIENIKDFALWKSVETEPSWLPKWAQKGRPGWHIECSALASHVFGKQIDIHAGGIDLEFPHHENEEVQCCAYYGVKQWVNYWIHSGHLIIENEKMSKSLGNMIFVEDLFRKNYRFPQIFRLALLMSNYRNDIFYKDTFMTTADSVWRSFEAFIIKYEQYYTKSTHFNEDSDLYDFYNKSIKDIDEALKDDFNTSKVIKVLQQLVNKVNDYTDSVLATVIYNKMMGLFEMFGLSYENMKMAQQIICQNYLMEFYSSVYQFAGEKRLDDLLVLCNDFNERTKNGGANDSIRSLKEFRDIVRLYSLKNSQKDLLQLSDHLRDNLNYNYGIQCVDIYSKKRLLTN